MNEEEEQSLSNMLYSDILGEDGIYHTKPLLAHYTSLQNLENILKNNQFWLSNPLYMNDLEEVRFGVLNGHQIFRTHSGIADALGTEERQNIFIGSLERELNDFANKRVIDLYAMCFSEQCATETDGRLSMWRGYGNNGDGAALIIDTSEIPIEQSSPLIFAKVKYASPKKRLALITKKADEVALYLAHHKTPDCDLGLVANQLFDRLVVFSVYTKHLGFKEEAEWRLVYIKDRDRNKVCAPMLSYFNGPKGIVPKLKLTLRPRKGLFHADFKLSDAIHSIILGPTASTGLAKLAVQRMLDASDKSELREKVKLSSIPFRP